MNWAADECYAAWPPPFINRAYISNERMNMLEGMAKVYGIPVYESLDGRLWPKPYIERPDPGEVK